MSTPVTRGQQMMQVHWSPRPLARLVVLLLLILVTGVGLAGPAAAHNVLTSSDPADGATLQTAPTVVRLTFDQPVQDFQPVVTVIGPDGQRYEAGTPQVDSTEVTTAVGELTVAGSYTIAYRVVSADGHPVQGELRFELAPAALTSSAPAGSTVASSSTSISESTAPSSAAEPTSTSGPAGSATPASSGPPTTTPTTTGPVISTDVSPSSGPTNTSSAPGASSVSSSSGLSGWVWAAIAVAVALIVTAIIVIIRRPKQPE